ncbi:MAG: AAA family ATPase [Methylococcales bacterium]|nr:AAA family ATPase [Methylococcales bacterium]
MYDSFYNLKCKPFQLNTDPDFFFKSNIHKSAMAYMRYGLMQGEGFVVITGDSGLGKTMLVKKLVKELLKNLKYESFVIGVLLSSQIEPTDTLRMILSSFGLPATANDKATLLNTMENFIKEVSEAGKRILLLVDEAQNLPKQSLEELRMLSNFEMHGKIVFQTFLIGQQGLRQTIFSPDMDQFKQRIISNYQLLPLSLEETKQYIFFRLEKAGWNNFPSFEDAIFQKVHQFTEGVPRKINTLCNRILFYAYLTELSVIGLESVDIVISELKDEMTEEKGSETEIAKHPSAINGMNESLEKRIAKIEHHLNELQISHNKEAALLRKAILLQLDMGDDYKTPLA